MPRKGITVYLPPNLETKVEKIAREQHRSESSVIAEAVRARFGGRDGDPLAPMTDQHAKNRLDARFDKVIGESIILKEVVLLFIRVWLEHNPPIAEEHEDAAAASAEARFERFCGLVRDALQSGRSPFDGTLEIHSEAPAPANGEAPPA